MPQLASPLKERRRALRLSVVNEDRCFPSLSARICDIWLAAGSWSFILLGWKVIQSSAAPTTVQNQKQGRQVCAFPNSSPAPPHPKPKRQRIDGVGTRHFIGCGRRGFLQRKANQGRKEREGGSAGEGPKASIPNCESCGQSEHLASAGSYAFPR